MKKCHSIIDADSQVTSPWWTEGILTELSERTRELVEARALRFGHGIFDEFHHAFYVILRNLPQTIQNRIREDILRQCQDHLGGRPDIVLFPGDSTICYLMREGGLLQADASVQVQLSQVLRAYGNHRVRCELSGAQRAILSQARPLRVLFVDDSMSSGRTESLAMEEYLYRRSGGQSAEVKARVKDDKWLTYVILERGVRRSKRPPFRNALRLPRSALLTLMGKHQLRSYCSIGPTSVVDHKCPFTAAGKTLSAATEWTEWARTDLVDHLARVARCAREVPIESRAAREAFLSPGATCKLLQLCGVEMPWSALAALNSDPADTSQLTASALYVALYHDDISAYLSERQIHILFRRFAGCVKDGTEESTTLLLALAMLPPSLCLALMPPVAERLVRTDSPSTLAAAVAISLVAHEIATQGILAEAPDGPCRTAIAKSLAKCRAEALQSVRHILDDFASSEMAPHREASLSALTNVSVLQVGPDAEPLLITARKLESLAGEGPHDEMHLPRTIEKVSIHTLDSVSRNILAAIACAESLSERLNLNMKSTLSKYRDEFQNLAVQVSTGQGGATSDALTAFRNKCKEFLKYLWHDSVLGTMFWRPGKLMRLLRGAVAAQVTEYRERGMPPLLAESIFHVCDIDDAMRSVEFFGTELGSMRAHVENMLRNPIQHTFGLQRQPAPQQYAVAFQKLAEVTLEGPFVHIYCRLNKDVGAFSLVFADRGTVVAPGRVGLPGSGTGWMKVWLQNNGGDFECRYCPNGLADLSLVADGIVPDRDITRAVHPELMTNIFITRFGVVWEE